ncbi:MAG: hypothetical protein Q9179_004642 [Wetmoreana sp. 5 TL-2023]
MAVWNLLADATMVALPMPVLWKLQMQARKKLELSIVFGMGIVVPADGRSICILTLTRVLVSETYRPEKYGDITKQNAIVVLIIGLEPIFGVINACLPFLPSVFHHIGESSVYLALRRYLRFKSSGSRQGQSMSGRDLNSGSQMKSRMGKQKNAFTELGDADTDVELLDQTCQDIGYEGSYKVSAGSLGSSKEADEEHIVAMPSLLVQQGWNNKAAGIQVRKDFSVNSVTRE